MEHFEGVKIVKKANVYHGGQVTSRTVIFPDGEMKTLGIMHPGLYRFSTEAPEVLHVLAGHARYKLTDDAEWRDVQTGESFHVPANSQFDIEVIELLDYACSYG